MGIQEAHGLGVALEPHFGRSLHGRRTHIGIAGNARYNF